LEVGVIFGVTEGVASVGLSDGCCIVRSFDSPLGPWYSMLLIIRSAQNGGVERF
jgi:hypothetical protein